MLSVDVTKSWPSLPAYNPAWRGQLCGTLILRQPSSLFVLKLLCCCWCW